MQWGTNVATKYRGEQKEKDVHFSAHRPAAFAEFLPMSPTCRILTRTGASSGVRHPFFFPFPKLGEHIRLGS